MLPPCGSSASCYWRCCACPTAAPPRLTRLPRPPLFTFVFDDGNDTDYLIGRQIFAEHGAAASTAIITGLINAPGHLNASQILALRDSGWEIMSHTVTHPSLTGLDRHALEDELASSKSALEALGVKVRGLVYPYNRHNALVREVAGEYYSYGRGGGSGLNLPPVERYGIKSYSYKSDLPRMEAIVDKAYAERGWLVAYHHELDAKLIVAEMKGSFREGEELRFEPSGSVGRFERRLIFPFYGLVVYSAPLEGDPKTGDTITGLTSGATGRVERVAYDDRTDIGALLDYIKGKYPDMRIVTIGQGLDLYGGGAK